jgi:putative nucleotidyltransferase with HDIG domain
VIPTREEAWALLTEWTQAPHLLKHALGVEAGMRGYARRLGGDAELWGVTGLLHDFDYERHPSLEEHPFVGAEELRRRGVDEQIVQAVLGHADHTGVERHSDMDHALYAVDEMVGFIVAVAMIRPSKSLLDLPVKSVTKKFKDKAFCRAVDRDHLRAAAEEIGLPLRDHVENLIEDLRAIAVRLELDGSLAAGS